MTGIRKGSEARPVQTSHQPIIRQEGGHSIAQTLKARHAGGIEGLPALTGTPLRRMLSIAQVAHVLGVSTSSVRRMISQGQLKAYRYGDRSIRIDPADLEAARHPVTIAA